MTMTLVVTSMFPSITLRGACAAGRNSMKKKFNALTLDIFVSSIHMQVSLRPR